MSLLSAIILPLIEKELISIKPEIAQFILNELKLVGHEIVKWTEEKLNIDLDGDGQIGGKEE